MKSSGGAARAGSATPIVVFTALALASAGVFVAVLAAGGVRPSMGAYHGARDHAIEVVTGGVPGRALAAALGRWLRHIVLSPFFYLSTAAILLLERLRPARPAQPLFSIGFAQDLAWYFLSLGLVLAVGGWFREAFAAAYDAHLGFLTVGAISRWPVWLRFLFGVLAGDFLAWLHHWVRHKVGAFWAFHAVHHAQRELNLWTNERVHVVDFVVATLLQTLPSLAPGVGTSQVAAFALVAAWYTRLYHANVRTRLGPLRYVLVTPQSHRVHHSVLPEHRDKNFGVLFSVWDRLFGTQLDVPAGDYPPTGVADAAFPLATRYVAIPRNLLREQVYPFVALFRRGDLPARPGAV